MQAIFYIGLGALFLTTLLAAFFGWRLLQRPAFRIAVLRNGERMKGRVVGYHTRTSVGSDWDDAVRWNQNVYQTVVEFLPSESDVVHRAYSQWCWPWRPWEVGSEVKLWVDPHDPNRAIVDALRFHMLMVRDVVLALVLVSLPIVFLVALLR